jgi:hypothetical protein
MQKVPVETHQQGFTIAEQDTPDHGRQIGRILIKPTSYHRALDSGPHFSRSFAVRSSPLLKLFRSPA